MAPKKTVDGKTAAPNKKIQEKKPKAKLLRPKLKTPSVKLSVEGSKNNMVTLSKGEQNKLTKKLLALEKKAQDKFDRANEVATAQLVKGKAIVFIPEPSQSEEPKQPKKRGRKKKVEEPVAMMANSEDAEPKQLKKRGKKKNEIPVVTKADAKDEFEASPEKKKCVRKEPAKGPKKDANANKRESTRSTNVKKSLTLTPQNTLKNKKGIKASETETKNRARKSKVEIGKPNEGDISTINNQQSPSLLDHKQIETLKGENTHAFNNPNIEACSIDSRKTSVNSEFSWTKDISSSSTTTCVTVCSTDFVRIDKKLPVLKLTDIEITKNATNNDVSSSDSESSDSKSSPDSKTYTNLTPDIETRSLQLSTSSITPTKPLPSVLSPQINITNDDINKITKALDKLSSKLQNFDLEIVNWIGYENEEVNVDVKRFQGKIFAILKEESEVIAHCQQLKKVLSDTVSTDDVNDKTADACGHDVPAVDDDPSGNSVDHDDKEEIDPYCPKVVRQEDNEHYFSREEVKYPPFDQNCDDDDALSLFAESITGIDSYRMNSSASVCNTVNIEEYIPQHLDCNRRDPSNRITYQPTKISTFDKPNLAFNKPNLAFDKPNLAFDKPPNLDIRTKAICEKQNADSTSIYKDQEKARLECFNKPSPDTRVTFNSIPNMLNTLATNNKTCLMARFYKPAQGMRSTVLRGVCFFNLLGSCKNVPCRFRHDIPTQNEIKAKLVNLSEEMFIQEYMLLRNWPNLRRKYGMCFVEECCRRDLTRILVEMAIDFNMKANENSREDALFAVEVTETALLHLNSVDLETCTDLLLHILHKLPLCDVFMSAIANTQNFSRFKPVFIKLTKFILRQKRTFCLDVATQILERLSVLPCERPLLEVLLEIVKNTVRKILDNAMIGLFEKQLLMHKDLYDQYKEEIALNRPVINSYESSCVNPAVEMAVSNTLVSTDREKRYTSPDTTNLDNMNKATDEPTHTQITRTVNLNNSRFNIQRSFSNSSASNESTEESAKPRNTPKSKSFMDWRGKSIFNHIKGLSSALKQPSPRQMGRQVYQRPNFGRSPPLYTRRSGPDYF